MARPQFGAPRAASSCWQRNLFLLTVLACFSRSLLGVFAADSGISILGSDFSLLQELRNNSGVNAGRRLDVAWIEVGRNERPSIEDSRFATIRELLGVPHDFAAVRELKLAGASGPQYFHNNAFVAMQCSSDDWMILHGFLDNYLLHLRQHVASLLPRYLTAIKIEEDKSWILMFNWMRPSVSSFYYRTYSIRGAIPSATEPKCEPPIVKDKDPMSTILEDTNFVASEGRIRLHHEQMLKVIHILEDDLRWYVSLKIVSYRLILTVSIVGMCNREAMTDMCHRQHHEKFDSLFTATNLTTPSGYMVGVDESDGLIYIYSLGLVGGLKLYKKSDDAKDCCVEPEQYADRLVEFLTNRLEEGHMRQLTRAECDIGQPLALIGGGHGFAGCYTMAALASDGGVDDALEPIVPRKEAGEHWFMNALIILLIFLIVGMLFFRLLDFSREVNGDEGTQRVLADMHRRTWRSRSVHFGLDLQQVRLGLMQSYHDKDVSVTRAPDLGRAAQGIAMAAPRSGGLSDAPQSFGSNFGIGGLSSTNQMSSDFGGKFPGSNPGGTMLTPLSAQQNFGGNNFGLQPGSSSGYAGNASSAHWSQTPTSVGVGGSLVAGGFGVEGIHPTSSSGLGGFSPGHGAQRCQRPMSIGFGGSGTGNFLDQQRSTPPSGFGCGGIAGGSDFGLQQEHLPRSTRFNATIGGLNLQPNQPPARRNDFGIQ